MKSKNWLVRNSVLQISRPIAQADLVRQIEAGEISENDEVCPSAGYWFSLKDADEVKKFFGNLRFPSRRKDEDEITETETETVPVTRTSIQKPVPSTTRNNIVFKPNEPDTMEAPAAVRGIVIVLGMVVVLLFFLIRFWLKRYSQLG